MNQRWVEVFVDFAAQARDVDVNDVGLRVKVVFPHFFEEHGAGDDLAGVAHQVFEQAEFARLQVDFAAAARDFALEAIELQVGDFQHHLILDFAAATPGQRLHAGEQFGEGVGFDEVVVAAGGEAFDAVIHFAERGEDEDGRAHAVLAQFFDDGEAVQFG